MKPTIFYSTVIFLGFTTAHAHADVIAKFESARDQINLMSDPCPGDESKKLRLANSIIGGTFKTGCFTLNERNNPVVIWEDGRLQELDGSKFVTGKSNLPILKDIDLNKLGPDSVAENTARPRPSFDCSKAKSNAEKLICSDEELAALDKKLAGIYRKAEVSAIDKRKFRDQGQAEWRWREKNCQTKSCLTDWYQRRINTLQLHDSPRPPFN